MIKRTLAIPLSLLAAGLIACTPATQDGAVQTAAQSEELPLHCDVPRTTPDPVGNFLEYANTALREAGGNNMAKNWAYLTNINPETQAAVTEAGVALMATRSQIVPEAAAFTRDQLHCQDQARQLHRFKTSISLPPPSKTEDQQALAETSARLVGHYGAASFCKEDGECLNLGQLSTILDTSRDYDELLFAWDAWRELFKSQKADYARFVELANTGARDLGFDDVGALWLSGYDTDPQTFEAEVERLYQEVKPLYEELHCYVRAKLADHYGEDKVALDAPIPAHLLGNMWSQEWSNIYPLVMPYPELSPLDITPAIVEKGWDPIEMTKVAENFFVSLGMRTLPDSFWTNSMFVKPDDREVVCHASAWDMDTKGDVRIKMCIEPTAEIFSTIHHELGHIYYYLYYNHLPFIYQSGANDGFHEGIGDTLSLSMTPSYMKALGLLDTIEESPEAIINQQMHSALERLSFLPFGLLIDRWRWKVFDGTVTPDQYNAYWWQLREEMQGIRAPNTRTEDHFDPGAKYHVPNNTPYLRYFLARILQFQFLKALCDAAQFDGPLHECSIYGNKDAGKALMTLLEKGAAQPWQQTLEELTGSPEMSTAAIFEYYAPLMDFLKEQNKDRTCGW